MRGSLIIQARTGSTRLPNKMTGLFGDESLLGWVIENLKSWRSVQTIVVATSTNDNDDAIERIALESGVACIRGDEEDVVARMLAAATWTNEGWIFRVCADNPFLCEDLFDELLLNVNRYPEASYIGFQVSGIPAILTDYGLFVEAINTAALKTVHPSLNAHQREHATLVLLESKDAILLPIKFSVFAEALLTTTFSCFRRAAHKIGIASVPIAPKLFANVSLNLPRVSPNPATILCIET